MALQALGYEDARSLPGDVVVADLVCLEPTEDAPSATWPRRRGARPGRHDPRRRRRAARDRRRPRRRARRQASRRHRRARRSSGRRGPTTVEVELIASPDDPDRTIIGFVPFDTASVELPFEIDIDTGSIGGPSAGLAFTLTLIDELSAGDLTGGADVAVTGEIGLDGTVGAIGGLRQKVSAVRQAGVDHFLVPTAQGEEQIARAREIAGDDVEIIPVATLDEALAALERARRRPAVPWTTD